ncbi:MAG: enoyl-CoA hydratase-related protein [Acidimicrobiales bacterium]
MQDRVATVTLNDPDRRNALSLGMVDALGRAFDELEADGAEVGAVVITGEGKAFCAGADLGALQDSGSRAGGSPDGGSPDGGSPDGGSPDGGSRDRLGRIYEGFLRISRSPLPTVAAVNGAAVGAGMNLALACDVILASEAARFDTRFLSIGLHPGGGHTWMLQRRVGQGRATAMIVFGQVLDGPSAVEAGLALEVVEAASLVDRARELAQGAADVPAPLSRRTKATLAQMAQVQDHGEAVELELNAQIWSMGQPFFAERLEALRRRISERRAQSG